MSVSEPVLTLLSQIDAEIAALPGCRLDPAPRGARNDVRLEQYLGRKVPPGVAAFFRKYNGGALTTQGGPGEAAGEAASKNDSAPAGVGEDGATAGRTARLLSFDESTALLERAGQSLRGLWPILQRDGQLVALDADVADGIEWPVVQVADRSVDRLGTSLLRFLHVLCAELRFDWQSGSVLELARERRLRDPHLSEHWVDLAEALVHAGQKEEAQQILTEGARCAEPVGPGLLAAIGLAALLEGDTARARVALEDAMNSDPLTARDDDARLDAAALLLLVAAEQQDGALSERAKNALKNATEATAGYWRAEAVRAVATGDDARANVALRLLVLLLPEDTDGPCLRAAAAQAQRSAVELVKAREALDMGDLESAVTAARQAVAALPDLGLAHATLAESLNAIHGSGALEHAQKAVELNPTLVDGWRELAEAHLEKRDMVGALAALDQGLARDPSYGLLHGKRAQVLLDQGRRIEALDAIGLASEYGGDAFFVAAVRGDILAAMEKHQDAAEAYEQALLYEPEDHWVLHQAALESMAAGSHERSAELFELALRHDRDGCHQTLVDYARLMQQTGRIGDAVRLYRRAVAAVPNEPNWRQSLREAEKELAAAPN